MSKSLLFLLFAVLASFTAALPAAETQAPAAAKAQSARPAAPAEQVAKVNINTADVETLKAGLLGIGQVKAQAIVDYRTGNGPYKSLDDLLQVKGIGASTLEKNRGRISLN